MLEKYIMFQSVTGCVLKEERNHLKTTVREVKIPSRKNETLIAKATKKNERKERQKRRQRYQMSLSFLDLTTARLPGGLGLHENLRMFTRT